MRNAGMDADLTPVVATLADLDEADLQVVIDATHEIPQTAPGLLGWLEHAHRTLPLPFRYRATGKWARERHVAEWSEIAGRCAEWGLPSQGVFTSEAATMLAGYGMKADNRAKSAGNFNSLWDDGELSVARGLDGRIQLYDRRLSLHWLVQTDVARHALHDPMLSSMGFWPRFLIDWPAPGAPMLARPFHADRHASIADYWRRCNVLLEPPLGEDCRNLPTIVATDKAQNLAGKFFERMQVAAKTSGGELETIKPFAIRATEQVFRVAGVLSAFTGGRTIDTAAMRDGIRLVAHSLETWLGIFGDRDEAEAREHALKLYEWMLRQPEQGTNETAILRIGPKALRSQHRRDTALAILEQYKLAARSRDRWHALAMDEV